MTELPKGDGFTMLPSVRALLEDILDYAGLFPPAALHMEEALERYAGHLRGPHRWMMARFVCPAGRLPELQALLSRIDEPPRPLRVSALGGGGPTAEAFAAGLAPDLDAIQSFVADAGPRAKVEQFEVRLPDLPAGLAPVVTDASASLETGIPGAQPFFEVSLLGDWEGRLHQAVAAIAGLRAAGRPGGLKIRCGGLEASAVPTAEAVGAAIAGCRDHGVPLKATQGLHHPIRHPDPDLGTTVHGFFNLFVAGVLTHSHRLDERALRDVVLEADPSAFRFGPDSVSWRDLTANLDQVRAARGDGVTSFGSCSFTEPVDDLHELGLITTETIEQPPDLSH
jgi:hypothetical protein